MAHMAQCHLYASAAAAVHPYISGSHVDPPHSAHPRRPAPLHASASLFQNSLMSAHVGCL
jgi:hypothetical protein